MGNYVPGLTKRTTNKSYVPVNSEKAGLHEQDDDRVRVVITPPTGTTTYTTPYIVAGLIGLIAVGGGIIFIKKKVLTK